jgi:hypothetical protein
MWLLMMMMEVVAGSLSIDVGDLRLYRHGKTK